MDQRQHNYYGNEFSLLESQCWGSHPATLASKSVDCQSKEGILSAKGNTDVCAWDNTTSNFNRQEASLPSIRVKIRKNGSLRNSNEGSRR